MIGSLLSWPKKISWKLTIIYTLMFILVLILLNSAVYLFLHRFIKSNINESINNTLQFILLKMQRMDSFSFNQYDAGVLQDISRSRGNIYFRILNNNKEIVAQSNLLTEFDFPVENGYNEFEQNGHRFAYKTISITKYGFMNGYLQVVRDVSVEYRFLDMLLTILIIAGILGGVGAIFIGYIITRKTLKPISNMTQTARNISVTDLDRRLEVKGHEDELTNLAETFNSLLDRIQKAFETQKQFVSDASHELRTPISVINGYIKLLDRWGKEEKEIRDEAISAIKNEVNNINSLLESLLFLARGDSEELEINRNDFSVNELIEEIEKETSMITDEIEVTGKVKGKLTYYGDRKLIKQLLRIFVDNSLKFTPAQGKITVESEKKDNHIILKVKDTGCGIPQEDLPHIFERFYQVDKSRSDEKKGTGLGLSIAKWVIEAHQGRVEVNSELGEGTEFKVFLPEIEEIK
ncbi:MAG: ATP-binding protein [Bacillota bacterium]